MSPSTSDPDAFIEYWSQAEASERANAQPFLIALADLLAVPHPTHSHTTGYSFEFPVHYSHPSVQPPAEPHRPLSARSFVLEAKQFAAQQPEQTELTLAAIAVGATKGKKAPAPSVAVALGTKP